MNNVFKPFGLGILEFDMRIYNRWGQEIFYSNSIDVGWDGTTGDSGPAGEVHFKAPGYQTGVLDELSFRHPNQNVVTMQHGSDNSNDNDTTSVN